MAESGRESLQRAQRLRDRTLALVTGLSQMELDYAPAPKTWSVGEILDHLILSDQVYYREIKALFDLKREGKPTYLRRRFSDFNPSVFFLPKSALPYLDESFRLVNLVLPRSLRTFFVLSRLVPTDAPDIAKPRPGRSGDAIRQELAAGPVALSDLFVGEPEADFNQFIHYHPLLGENNLYQLLVFLTNHETVHQRQIEDTLPKIKR